MSYQCGMLPSMYSTPGGNLNQPCWHCTYFIALVYEGAAARCVRAGQLSIQAAPTTGCAFWQREPGVDDEPRPPFVPGGAARLKRQDLPLAVAWAP